MFSHSPKIVTNGLVGYWDAFNNKSYSGSSKNISMDILIVGGGGAGRSHYVSTSTGGGGGGAGGFILTTITTTGITSNVVIGDGGISIGDDITTKGGDSSVLGLIAYGGGAGSSRTKVGTTGGSGGGGGYDYPTGYDGYLEQGNNGGNAMKSTYYGGGGGGGAGSEGVNGTTTIGGSGGSGIKSSISGTEVGYCGGGGGAIGNGGGDNWGTSSDGGGHGGSNSTKGIDGTPNTGGGGGGAPSLAYATGLGGDGGSGIVIIRYKGNQKAIGGDITNVSGYTIHTFLTDGTFEMNSWEWLDLSGFSNHLTNDGILINSPTYTDNSFLFDGSNEYVIAGDDILSIGGDITISSWVKLSILGSYFGGIYGGCNASPRKGVTMGKWNDDKWCLFVGKGDETYWHILSNNTAVINMWYYVTGVIDSGTMSLYVNGKKQTSTIDDVTLYPSDKQTVIGRWYGKGSSDGYYYNGNISNVSVYNRCLSQSEVKQNFNATKGRFGL